MLRHRLQGLVQRRRVPVMPIVVLAVTTSMIAACSSDSDSTSAPTGSGAASVNAQAATDLPDDAVDKAVGRLDGLADGIMQKTGIPGMAIAVVHGGRTVYAKGFGVADVGTGRKVDADTVFQLASVSKSVGASVVATQVTNRKVEWDTPVTEHLKGFALSNPYVTSNVTIADMYAHRSGLPEHVGDKLEDLGFSRDDILARLRQVPLSPFRITYDYTNFGLTAGAESVAAAAGADWATLSQNALYGPLGMASTSSRDSDFVARPDRAVGHVKTDGRWVVNPSQREPDAQTPAGGVSSSVNDLSHWLRMMLANGTYDGRAVASPESLLPAVSPQIVANPPADPSSRTGFYGYGFNASITSDGRTEYSHSGAFSSGAATNFLVLPTADVAIVTLTNAAPVGAAETIDAEFADLVQYGKIRDDWSKLYGEAFASLSAPFGSLVGKAAPANSAPAQPLSTYVGTYDNPYWGAAQITENNGTLTLAMGPAGRTRYSLSHRDGNVFTFDLRNENAEAGSISAITFDGRSMTVEYYTDDGNNGVFTRR